MKVELIAQYQAALRMLDDVITRCPDDLWQVKGHAAPYWHIVYHSLHYTNLYLSANEDTFIPWAGHRPDSHRLERAFHAYPKAEMKAYLVQLADNMPARILALDLAAASGFEWLQMNNLQLQLYNLRHLQHHVGQLVVRLHQAGISGISWIG